MAARTMPTTTKVETEGDLQIVYFTLTAVSDADTLDVSAFFKAITMISLTPSTSAGAGATTASTGIVTFKISTGTPDLKIRLAGN